MKGKKDYIIYTASDPVAGSLVGYLEDRGFLAYDEVLAEAATVLVFDTTKAKLVKALRDAKGKGIIEEPYRVSIAEVGSKELVLVSG